MNQNQYVEHAKKYFFSFVAPRAGRTYKSMFCAQRSTDTAEGTQTGNPVGLLPYLVACGVGGATAAVREACASVVHTGCGLCLAPSQDQDPTSDLASAREFRHDSKGARPRNTSEALAPHDKHCELQGDSCEIYSVHCVMPL